MATKRVVWLTDVHFNFVELDRVEHLIGQIDEEEPDAVLFGGDIAEAHDVADWLLLVDDRLTCPVYLVLGNHDYYHGSITQVRQAIRKLCSERSKLKYLTFEQVVSLAPNTALIGHDGWSDARANNYDTSTVMLNDYLLIEELRGITREQRREVLGRLGDEAADHIQRHLRAALKSYHAVMLLTHSPPMREACWYEGRTADDNWAPHFTCVAVGEAIMAVMSEFPDQKLTVLCGHTHNPGVYCPLPNVEIITGEAEYHDPRIGKVFEVE